MKNISIQKSFGWCNVHLLANILRDERFKRHLNDEYYKSGNADTVTELLHNNKYNDWVCRPIIGVVPEYNPIPDSYLIHLMEDDNFVDEIKQRGPVFDYPFIPYLLTVEIKSPHFHAVAVLKFKDRYLYIDPYMEDIVILRNLSDLPLYFNKCIGIDIFVQIEGDDERYLLLNGEYFGFDKIKDCLINKN